MNIDNFGFFGEGRFQIEEVPFGADKDVKQRKKALLAKTEENLLALSALQDRLYAQGTEGLIVVIQALDAAGKDSLVRHVFSCMSPEGVSAYSFKAPSAEELAHDYLWRVMKAVPPRGTIGVFNRSHYEDVLPVKILQLQKNFPVVSRVKDDEEFFDKRIRQICDFERYLYENGYRMIKVFLNVSAEKQKERFLERMDRPEKHWKFASSDLRDREKRGDYLALYEELINKTSKKHGPWYCLPADNKWYTRYLMTELLVKTLTDMAPEYPPLSKSEQDAIPECREILAKE
jgi:PPK2 family polyphosphate:nucleotide phosphotransferase